MLLLCIRTLLLITIATLDIDSWCFEDSNPPRYDNFRIQELVLSGDNPVITGFICDITPADDNRLFTMREYELFAEDSISKIWFFNYDSGDWDDDGYAIMQYMTGGGSPEERFRGVGFYQVDLDPDPDSSETESGLAVLLDDDGDTVNAPYIFAGDDWYDACCRDVEYIGSLGGESEVYATCGWYGVSGVPPGMRGFLEIAHANTEIALIEDSNIRGSWQKILYDSSEDLLVMGGFLWNSSETCNNLRVGCVDVSTTPYDTIQQEDWEQGDYNLLEGPLVLVDDGLYIYLGDDSDEVVAATFWCWDTLFSPPLILEDTEVYTSDSEFDGYDHLGVFAATYVSALEKVIMLVNATTDDQAADPYILVVSIAVNPVRKTLGIMSRIATLDPDVTNNYDARGHDFVFTSTSPVEGIGGGEASYGSDSDFWIFEIDDI